MTTLSLPANDAFSMLLNQLAEAFGDNATPAEAQPAARDVWSDEALVRAIVNGGNQQHFRTLLARHKVKVHRIALSVLGPSRQAQAEDVAQEVFIKLYQRLESFRGDCRFSTWLYRLAINAALDYQRKNLKFEAMDIDEMALPGSADNASRLLEADETALRVNQAVNTLPQTQRMMVYLFYWLEFRIREIAEVMDCPQGTVKVYLLRARKILAEQLGSYLDE
jgi:RNA polymerase sigma-70 factor (ECF subfamily)